MLFVDVIVYLIVLLKEPWIPYYTILLFIVNHETHQLYLHKQHAYVRNTMFTWDNSVRCCNTPPYLACYTSLNPACHTPPYPACNTPLYPACHTPPYPICNTPPYPACHTPPYPACHTPPYPACHSPL